MNPKKYLRIFFYNLVALWLVSTFIQGVDYLGGYQTLLLAALALTGVNLLVRPLLKLLFLPINLLTLGAFRWLINVIALYLVTMIVPQFKVAGFVFDGFAYQGFVIPAVNLGSFWALVVVSFFISVIPSFLYWLRK